MSKILVELKEKVKVGLELALIGAASIGWFPANSKAYQSYQQPPAIVEPANQTKPETNAPTANQEAKQEEKKANMDVFIPLYYDQGTKNPQMYLMSANHIYRVKLLKDNTFLDYSKKEDWYIYQVKTDNANNFGGMKWVVLTSPSDNLKGVLRSALNGDKEMIEGKDFIFEDADRNGEIYGRAVEEKDKVPIEEVQRIIDKNVYHINNRGKK